MFIRFVFYKFDVYFVGATMASNRRSELWSSKRVFFVTPQVISNDLAKGVCPARSIKCLVVDEAHKALGNHAYCQVRNLHSFIKPNTGN